MNAPDERVVAQRRAASVTVVPHPQQVATIGVLQRDASVPEIGPFCSPEIPPPLTIPRPIANMRSHACDPVEQRRNVDEIFRVRRSYAYSTRFETTFLIVAVHRGIALRGQPAELRDDLCRVTLDNKQTD